MTIIIIIIIIIINIILYIITTNIIIIIIINTNIIMTIVIIIIIIIIAYLKWLVSREPELRQNFLQLANIFLEASDNPVVLSPHPAQLLFQQTNLSLQPLNKEVPESAHTHTHT